MEIITSEQAANFIKTNDVVGIGGFNGWSCPDALLQAVAIKYEKCAEPSNLTAVCGVAPGALTDDGWGLSRLKAKGLLGTVIAAHIGIPLAIGNAIGSNQIAGYTLPLGVYEQLLRAKAGHRPGIVTKTGLYTFADPRLDGCKVNELAKMQDRNLVSLIQIENEDYLFYKTFPIDVCLLRGTFADEAGNISLEEEALISEQREMACAVHNHGGIVIVQVREIVKNGSIPAREVAVHNHFVDYVVVSEPDLHPQGYDTPALVRKELLGKIRVPDSSVPKMELSVKKVIARRAARELKKGSLVNLGIGIPAGVANIANEEGMMDDITLSIEGGTIGGIPMGGLGLGASINPEAVYSISDTFDFYDGGGLDMAFLGLAEADGSGNVNVSRFGGRCTGPGGFIDITQNTKAVFFLGTFTAGNMEAEIQNGTLNIIRDGNGVKFKKNVEQITFSSRYALQTGQRVLFITERAVFQLKETGLVLKEIAPGIDLEKDILSKMEFMPEVSSDLKVMDAELFQE